jgi:hypothetical protein
MYPWSQYPADNPHISARASVRPVHDRRDFRRRSRYTRSIAAADFQSRISSSLLSMFSIGRSIDIHKVR